MISLQSETILPLSQAAKCLPGRSAAGRPPHVATLYRWASRGICGVRLETLRLGGGLVTSAEALQRFAERVTATRDHDFAVQPSADLARNAAAAGQALTHLGI